MWACLDQAKSELGVNLWQTRDQGGGPFLAREEC